MFADRAGVEDLTAKALASTAVAELRAEMAGRNGLVHDERPGPVGALTCAS